MRMCSVWAGTGCNGKPARRLGFHCACCKAAPKTNGDAKTSGLKWMAGIAKDGRAARCLDAAVKAAAAGVADKAPAVRECGHALISVLFAVHPLPPVMACLI